MFLVVDRSEIQNIKVIVYVTLSSIAIVVKIATFRLNTVSLLLRKKELFN